MRAARVCRNRCAAWIGRLPVSLLCQCRRRGLAARDPEELPHAALSHLMFAQQRRAATRWCGSSTPRCGSMAFSRRTPSSRWSTTTCRSWSIRSASRWRSAPDAAFPGASGFCGGARPRRALLRGCSARSAGASDQQLRLESFQHIEVDRIVDAALLARWRRRSSAACAMCAWPAPTGPRCAAQRSWRRAELTSLSARFDPEDVSEACALLRGWPSATSPSWAIANTGCAAAGAKRCEPVAATGFGILRHGRPRRRACTALCQRIRRQIRSREIAVVTKANSESTVHRPATSTMSASSSATPRAE